MRSFLRIIVIAGLVVTLGCQAEKDLEQCQLAQRGLGASLGECEDAKKHLNDKSAEVIDFIITNSREELKKCNTHWKGKLEESQQKFSQANKSFEDKVQGMQKELQEANENNQALLAELQEVKNALTAAVEKNKAANIETAK